MAFDVVGLAVLLLIVPDLRPCRSERTQQPRPAPTARVRLRHLATPQPGRLLGAAMLLGILTIGHGFLYLELTERDSLATKYFPLLYVGANFAYLALTVPFGRMADRIARGRVFIGGPVLLLVSYLCAGGAISGPVASVACPLLLGGYYAATDGVLAAISLCPTPIRASGIATAQTAVAIARFATSLGFGLMWTELGRVHALLLVSAMPAAGIPVAAGLLPGIGTAPPDHHAPRPVAVEV